MATKPTFCTNAHCMKAPKRGASADESMSARKPSAIRLLSTWVSTISPIASKLAVVSVKITIVTILMVKIAGHSNTGIPKPKILGNAIHAPSLTLEKSAKPNANAAIAPQKMESRTAKRLMAGVPNLVSSNKTNKVKAAKPIFSIEPQFSALGLPPIIQRIATGKSEIPIMAIIEPVTIGGKNRTILEKNGAIMIPKIELTIIAPRMA